MSVLHEYAPESVDDLIGNPKAHKQLEQYILDKTPVIIVGGPGRGKTSAVYAIAKQHGYQVHEINASDERRQADISEIATLVQMQSIFDEKWIYLLDEIDYISAWATLHDMLQNYQHPIVMTCNDLWRVPKDVQNVAMVITLRNPRVDSVVKHVKTIVDREGLTDVDYSHASPDIRNTLISVLYGSEGYETKNTPALVTKLFTTGELDPELSFNDHAWLLDNAHKFLRGYQLYEFFRILEVASRSSPEALRLIPTGKLSGRDWVNYPNYYRLRSRNNPEEDPNTQPG